MGLSKSKKCLVDEIFKDKNGRIVVIQFPNATITGWFIFMLLSNLSNDSKLSNNLELISILFLFTWAYLELDQGANYFRKFLGFVVLLFIIIPIIYRGICG